MGFIFEPISSVIWLNGIKKYPNLSKIWTFYYICFGRLFRFLGQVVQLNSLYLNDQVSMELRSPERGFCFYM